MGVKLANQAMQPEWAEKLDPLAHLVLVAMALHCIDPSPHEKRPTATYWGGHALLALQCLKTGDSPAGLQSIGRSIAQLKRAGALVELSPPAGRYSKARYLLTLEPWKDRGLPITE